MMPSRRRFAAALAGSPLAAAPVARIRAVTSGPKHHFFGYYGIPPWSGNGKSLVCLQSEFQDHLPRPAEAAAIVLLDARTGALRKVAETRAWNFQQGAMLHWNPLKPDSEILFNERSGDDIISSAVDVNTGRRRDLPRAINGVGRNGRLAVCLTYGRLTRMRPVVGYVGARDPNPDVKHPANDGVFIMDLQTGKHNLVVSIEEAYRRLVGKHPELTDRHMWFNHTVFNRNDTRFFFLARCWNENKRLESAMFTCGVDGSGLREVVPFGLGVSHFEWRNNTEILATFRFNGVIRHVLFTDGERDYRSVGEGFLEGDGHCSFAPDAQWMVTDRNHGDPPAKSLMILNLESGEKAVLGKFPMGKYLGGDLRCDLHPRWSRDGRAICFDALEPQGWTRQLHVAELTF